MTVRELHLRPLPEDVAPEKPAPRADAVYFVIQRANGSWTPAAKIITASQTEETAEAFALQMKRQHPQQNFGVFMLRSEAREVEAPIEIVRVAE